MIIYFVYFKQKRNKLFKNVICNFSSFKKMCTSNAYKQKLRLRILHYYNKP